MTYEVRISAELLVETLTTGYELRGLLRVTKGLPAGAKFVGILANEIGAGGELRLLFADGNGMEGHNVAGVQIARITKPIDDEPAARAIALLAQAELDCRGYEALHSWVEPAADLLAGLGMLR